MLLKEAIVFSVCLLSLVCGIVGGLIAIVV